MNRKVKKPNQTRYVSGAIASILLTPLLLGIAIAFMVGEMMTVPIFIFFGAIYAAPLGLLGTLLYMLVEYVTPGRWWHAALIGTGLMAGSLALISQQIWPETIADWRFLGIMCAIAMMGATIFWYFSQPKKVQIQEINDSLQ